MIHSQFVRFILLFIISISVTRCQDSNKMVLDSSLTYVLDTSIIDSRIGKVKTMPLVVNILDSTIQFLRLEDQPKSNDLDKNKSVYIDYRYALNDEKIIIEDSIYFVPEEIGNDRLYLNTSSHNYAYRRVKSKGSSDYFFDEIQSKNIEFYESETKKIFLSPINYCSYNSKSKFLGIEEINFIDSHCVILARDYNTFYTNGLLLIKYGLFTMSVIEMNIDSSFTATVQGGSGYLYNSKVENKRTEILKDVSLDLVSEIINKSSSCVINYGGHDFTKGNIMLAVNESSLVSVEDEKFVLGLESVNNGINLTLDGIVIDHYFPLNISPTGKRYYTSNERCNNLILEKESDNKFIVSLKMTVLYGDDLENRGGWNQRAEFILR